eukprot:TRINITY_DN3419_c0_g5_i1.p1 TRINITY_DN3419_c0_g5~~TRINITY_DN3419_c0_g5_i1.p1  ORF type:complete len:821 (+),score=178.85 TRINITY_DN3419_c0_g5_i1:70-2532(+)
MTEVATDDSPGTLARRNSQAAVESHGLLMAAALARRREADDAEDALLAQSAAKKTDLHEEVSHLTLKVEQVKEAQRRQSVMAFWAGGAAETRVIPGMRRLSSVMVPAPTVVPPTAEATVTKPILEDDPVVDPQLAAEMLAAEQRRVEARKQSLAAFWGGGPAVVKRRQSVVVPVPKRDSIVSTQPVGKTAEAAELAYNAARAKAEADEREARETEAAKRMLQEQQAAGITNMPSVGRFTRTAMAQISQSSAGTSPVLSPVMAPMTSPRHGSLFELDGGSDVDEAPPGPTQMLSIPVGMRHASSVAPKRYRPSIVQQQAIATGGLGFNFLKKAENTVQDGVLANRRQSRLPPPARASVVAQPQTSAPPARASVVVQPRVSVVAQPPPPTEEELQKKQEAEEAAARKRQEAEAAAARRRQEVEEAAARRRLEVEEAAREAVKDAARRAQERAAQRKAQEERLREAARRAAKKTAEKLAAQKEAEEQAKAKKEAEAKARAEAQKAMEAEAKAKAEAEARRLKEVEAEKAKEAEIQRAIEAEAAKARAETAAKVTEAEAANETEAKHTEEPVKPARHISHLELPFSPRSHSDRKRRGPKRTGSKSESARTSRRSRRKSDQSREAAAINRSRSMSPRPIGRQPLYPDMYVRVPEKFALALKDMQRIPLTPKAHPGNPLAGGMLEHVLNSPLGAPSTHKRSRLLPRLPEIRPNRSNFAADAPKPAAAADLNASHMNAWVRKQLLKEGRPLYGPLYGRRHENDGALTDRALLSQFPEGHPARGSQTARPSRLARLEELPRSYARVETLRHEVEMFRNMREAFGSLAY